MSSNLKLKSNAGGSVSLIVDDTLLTDETVNACGLGQLQTWQNVIGSRQAGVEYTNDTGKPISVYIGSGLTTSGVYYLLECDGVTVDMYRNDVTGNKRAQIHAIIPNGSVYSLNINATEAPTLWAELRG